MSIDPTLRHQGPLEKQGKLNTWAWKKYWFSLHDAQLVYIKEDAKTASRKRTSSSQGEINMMEAQSVKECRGVNHGFPFQIVTKSRTHVLSAETSESREQWLTVLRDAMLVKSRKSRMFSQKSETISETVEVDDGAYESVMGQTTSSTSSEAVKPPLTMSQSEMERQPRCNSEYVDDGTYDPVFDAVADQGNNSDEEENTYAEVVNAIRPGDTLKEEEDSEADDEAKNEAKQGDGIPFSYSYVEMRKKSAKDYAKKGEDSTVGDYADVYGNESGSGQVTATIENTALQDKEEKEQAGGHTSTGSISQSYSQVIPKALRQTSKPEEQKAVEEDKGQAGGHTSTSSITQSYSQVIPKALRQTRKPEEQKAVVEEDYDDVEVLPVTKRVSDNSDSNNNSGSLNIEDLPNPRLELTMASAFDEIRRFLAFNRGPDEVFKTPPQDDLGGKAIEKLRNLLEDLEKGDNGVVVRPKLQGETGSRTIESTHL